MICSLCGRAELIRALAQNDPSTTASMADMLGYHETPLVAQEPKAPPVEPLFRPDAEATEAVETSYDPADVPFWRLAGYESISYDGPPVERQMRTYVSWRARPTTPPDFTPLASNRVVLTRLRQDSATRRSTRDIDDEVAVERLSRASFLDDIPRRQRRAWGSELVIVKDRARRLMPYWQDQDVVVDALRRLYPTHGITVIRLRDGERQLMTPWGHQKATRLPEAPVLVLSDLGCLANGGDALRRFWWDWGRRLRAQRTPAIALVPLHVKTVDQELARVWTLIRWDASSPTVADELPPSRSDTVERLLTLLSPAVRLEPGLVRAVRRLLPEGRRDAGLEAHLWQHAAIASRHSVAASWDPARRKTYQSHFAGQPEIDRQGVLDLLRTWRANVHPAVWFEELIGLDEHTRNKLIDAAEVEDAMAFLTVFAKAVWRSGDASTDTKAWAAGLVERLPDAAFDDAEVREALHYLYDLARPDVAVSEAPWWYDLAVLPRPAGQAVRQMMVWQTADQLHLHGVTPSSSADADPIGRGSPLGVVQTANGEVKITPDVSESTAEFWRTRQPPDWARRWGHDEFGPWVIFGIRDVEQRMRWIPPGRFWMGSLKDEEDRYDGERPRHEVALTRGYWLFDTPCTQALWQTVMGANPSWSKEENRPVEHVSWEDCQAFINTLNEERPGLALRLPTEAQWEYACRARTQTARYESDLDGIAWYEANSYGETHEVGEKRPNAWGLYDMLGNVWEWVQDRFAEDYYRHSPIVDPQGPDAGANRVSRGGGWDDSAPDVRAAYRFWLDPGDRSVYLGFRCSSLGSEPARAREAWHESERKAEPAETRPGLPAARLLNLSQRSSLETVFPDSSRFYLSTDHDRLDFDRITRPSWATEIGRDAYGLWVMLEVDGVRQRLRWIPPGRFWMGSPEDEEGRFDNEGPRHEVALTRGYWLFDTPCTQALWQAVMGENPSRFRGKNLPVETVRWTDCQAFMVELNEALPGLGLDLPTEAQWEYACRAGTHTARYESDLDGIAWYEANSDGKIHEVGERRPNAWGLYDMLGNVWEWCHDGRRAYEEGLVTDPVGPTDAGADRVGRGGSWYDPAQYVRAAFRYWLDPGYRDVHLGFRCSSSAMSVADGMRRERRRAESEAREDRDRSDDGERSHKGHG